MLIFYQKKGKIIKAIRLTLLTIFLCLSSLSLKANEKVIHFKGNVVTEGCYITTHSKSPNVVLGQVNKTIFNGIGSTSEEKKFTIELEKCAYINTINITLGNASAQQKEYYPLTNEIEGGAKGVAVKIRINGGEIQKPGEVIAWTLPANTNSLKLDYLASYIQTEENVTAGKADAQVSFTIDYK